MAQDHTASSKTEAGAAAKSAEAVLQCRKLSAPRRDRSCRSLGLLVLLLIVGGSGRFLSDELDEAKPLTRMETTGSVVEQFDFRDWNCKRSGALLARDSPKPTVRTQCA